MVPQKQDWLVKISYLVNKEDEREGWLKRALRKSHLGGG